MPQQISLRQLLDSGAVIAPHEAIAIVQHLLQQQWDLAADRRLRLDDLMLAADGNVEHPACAAPQESEIGGLLDAMLPAGTGHRVPGALRLAVARACRAVDAPPFGSLAALSSALERFERGDRHEIVRGLVVRAPSSGAETPAASMPPAPTPAPASPPPVTPARPTPVPAPLAGVPAARQSRPERRRQTISVSALRRDLRDADLRLYKLQARLAAMQSQEVVSEPPRPRSRMVAFVAAVLLSFAAGYAGMTLLGTRTAGQPAASSAFPRSAPAAVLPWETQTSLGDAATSAVATGNPATSEQMPSGTSGLVQAMPEFAGAQFSPAFAPDGRAIYFHTGRSSDVRSALMFDDESDGRAAVTTIVNDGARNYHVQPSPDGRHIAFDSDRDGERGVYLANSNGDEVRRVTGSGYAAVPTWAPDSRHLSFIRAEADRPKVWNLWLLAIESGDTRRLTSYRFGQTWGASWFADGTHICYTHEQTIVVLNVETGATREFPSPVAGHTVRTPAVSPQGDRVVFQVHGSGVWLLDLRSGSMRPMLDDRTAEEFAWSPDGRLVAFHSRRGGEWRIWTMRTDREKQELR